MTRKTIFYALAVVVLTGGMAVAALADDHGMNAYGPADSSVSSQLQEVEQPASGEIREPMETGSVPDPSKSSVDRFKESTGEVPTVELGGRVYRPGIDLGD